MNLPKNWSLVSLDKVSAAEKGAFRRGPFGGSIKKEFFVVDGPYKVYEQKNAIESNFEIGHYFIDDKKYKELEGFNLKADDLIISCAGTIGKVAIVPKDAQPGIINQALMRIRPNLNVITPRYLKWFFESPLAQKDIFGQVAGTALKNLAAISEIKKSQIPLPPLEEQHRIAAILDKADAILSKRFEAIRLTEELLRAAFLDMFGDPVTNPKGWDVINLKSVVTELRYGTSVKCQEVREGNDFPILRIPNIICEKIYWDDLKYAEIEPKEAKKLALKAGDILFVRTNGNPEYIGRCAVFEESFDDTLYASYLIRARLKPNTAMYPAFIRDIISFPTYRARLVSEARTTAGNYNINTEGLGRLRLIKPPLEKQENYIKMAHQLSIRNDKQKKHLKDIDKLFNSLLHRAFRGEL